MKIIHPILLLSTLCCALAGHAQNTVIFSDDFNSADSYHTETTLNATCKEYTSCMEEGHLLKKWIYTWNYSYEGDWRQAFYSVPKGASYMEQSGRSAANLDNYRLLANTPVPSDAERYIVEFKLYKADNDPIFFLLGADIWGNSGVEIGYENQLPGTDQNAPDAYLKGHLLPDTKVVGMGTRGVWWNVKIDVRVSDKFIVWTMNDKLMAQGRLYNIKNGGYFGMYVKYDRGSRFDDFKITVTPKYTTNETPLSIYYASASLRENKPAGTLAGVLKTIDPNIDDTFTYTLVQGTGSVGGDNSCFTIRGDSLFTTRPLDYETKSVYSLYLKSTDKGGLSRTQELLVAVGNIANETNAAEQLNETGFRISPNPCHELLYIEHPNTGFSPYTLEVYDLTGKNLYRERHDSPVVSIDVSPFCAGVCLLRIHHAGKVLTSRFIKQEIW